MIRTGTLALLCGVVLLQQLAVLPSTWLLLVCLLLSFTAFIRKAIWLRVLCFWLFGFAWAGLVATHVMQKQLAPELVGKDIKVIGYIASLPVSDERRVRFEFDIENALSQHALSPQRIRLSWYQYTGPSLQPGDRLQLTVRLKPVRNFYNPASFEYAGHMLQQGILVTGYVRKSTTNQLIEHDSLAYPVQQLRFSIREKLSRQLQNNPMEAVIRGLVIGDRSGMQSGDWNVLRNTGTIHLLAISGLHIGLVAGLVFLLVRRCWSLSVYCCNRIAAPRAAAVFAWLFAFIYAALAGFSLPTQRAMIMLSVILLAIILQRQVRASNVLSIALLTILVLDPFSVLSAGFWLSFAAVAMIYYLLLTQHSQKHRWHNWTRIQVMISLCLIPLLIWFFQQAPGLSPLANIIAVPVVSLLVVPLALSGVFITGINLAAGGWLLNIAASCMELLWKLLQWFAEIDNSTWFAGTSGFVPVILAMTGILVMLLPRAIPARWLGIILCFPILFQSSQHPGKGEVFLSVLDVGQGLASVIQTENHVLVFDTGPKYSERMEAGSAIINPFLTDRAIRKIDMMVVSHGDNDHAGGANAILNRFNVDSIVTSVPEKLPSIKTTRCQAGKSWQWDEVTFRFMHPQQDDYTSELSENNLSCVLQAETRYQRILLTGDIEKKAELLLLTRAQDKLRSTILVVPHHGSKTSSTSSFLDAVQPEIAILPVGWKNRFRLPAQQVMTRMRDRHIRIYSTADDGAVILATGKQIKITKYRQIAKRYWHYEPQINDTFSAGRSLLKLAAD